MRLNGVGLSWLSLPGGRTAEFVCRARRLDPRTARSETPTNKALSHGIARGFWSAVGTWSDWQPVEDWTAGRPLPSCRALLTSVLGGTAAGDEVGPEANSATDDPQGGAQ